MITGFKKPIILNILLAKFKKKIKMKCLATTTTQCLRKTRGLLPDQVDKTIGASLQNVQGSDRCSQEIGR